MEEEMNSLLENHTYELVKLSKGRKILKNKWVFKLKNDGKNLRYKARLVVKGFGQKKGIDFDENFSHGCEDGFYSGYTWHGCKYEP